MLARVATLLAAFLALVGSARCNPPADDGLQVASLRCEYLSDPLGIDVTAPRLGWQIRPSDPARRGVLQSEYQVLVASSTEELQRDHGDLWDSGRVKSSNSTHVAYRGKPLASGTFCHWKARVCDQKGHPSAWSVPAKWSMGPLRRKDWKAQWIGVAKEKEPSSDPWLRKTFSLPGAPTRAMAYVASVGYHELFINGKRVGDRVLEPSISDLTQRARYVTYDVAKYLKPGSNVIVLWCAAGWARHAEFHIKDKPLVLAQIDMQQPDGRATQIVTDATWRSHASPMCAIGDWEFADYGGERYDARLEVPGWCDANLDDSTWQAVRVFDPQLRVSAEMIEPNHCVETIKPVDIRPGRSGEFRVDMGKNYTGWFEIRMKGRPGQKVTLGFAERPEQTATFNQISEYIFGDSGTGVFCNRFNYAAFRWVTITGLETAPKAEDICGYLITTDCPRTGRFACSNALLNQIYETTVWTYRSLSLGGYVVDCPHRERRGYGGDAHATMETALTNYSVGAFYTKWLEDWRDVQRSDGNLPYTAPTYVGGGGPAWSGICITLPWQVYLHYGDRRILKQSYPTMQRWIAFLNTKAKNNLLRRWGGIWDFLGDWVPPGKGQGPGTRVDERSTLLFNNCYYLDNLNTIAKVADLLGNSDEAKAYRTQAEAVATAIHGEFFHPDSQSYANGTQLYEAMPLLVGATPHELRFPVMKRLEKEIDNKQGHIDTGIHGTYYLLKQLLAENRNDLIYQMVVQRAYPGWGYMLDHGATTLWEQWDGKNSLLHSSFVSVGSWFLEGLAGIRLDPAQPGYKHFVIQPGVVGDLTWANGEIDSPYGPIESAWKLSDGWLTLTVDVPANASATVMLMTDGSSSVTEGGRPADQSPGVHFGRIGGRGVAYDIDSGHYVFRARWQTQ